MFEQIVNLITRGVVALEIIAKHYETVGAAVGKQEDKKPAKAKKEVVEDDDAEDEAPAKGKKATAKGKAKKEVVEDDDDEAEDEKPAKGKKAPAKGKGKKDADPLAEMRDEIKQYAAIIAGGDDDDANDEFDDLLEAFEIKSIAKLEDDDVEDFHKDLKEIVETYFELED
ncbi:hypothetical protein [Escherichia phage vB_EcoS_011D5]|uniref:Uncharacterized protein n=2 Tax=Dhillonvirus TaxID=1623289 RepID=A0A7D7IR09_9CAUD|nr:hypothetical protein P9632_gp13 [Escherichia phage vB_EcoS_011D5]YP_010742374.1 hypothetical protein P9633_gp13 [Escherichia phage vB_EcoS_L-h 1M]QMP82788.1 hypothetical protein [Escherichia phage vB_EcoS_011D5]UNY42279.1 hypothetical protein [Escherichia phage vB_EcoS_L-h 1M]